MLWLICGDIGVVGMRSVQSTPSHSQVSAKNCVLFEPPNITTTPRAMSYASACPYRAVGFVLGKRWIQFEPFHSHVLLNDVGSGEVKATPPNSTITLRAISVARRGPYRAGGAAAGLSCCHTVPVQRQVSLSSPPLLLPPNSTRPPPTGSKASADSWRAVGNGVPSRYCQFTWAETIGEKQLAARAANTNRDESMGAPGTARLRKARDGTVAREPVSVTRRVRDILSRALPRLAKRCCAAPASPA